MTCRAEIANIKLYGKGIDATRDELMNLLDAAPDSMNVVYRLIATKIALPRFYFVQSSWDFSLSYSVLTKNSEKMCIKVDIAAEASEELNVEFCIVEIANGQRTYRQRSKEVMHGSTASFILFVDVVPIDASCSIVATLSTGSMSAMKEIDLV